MNVIEQKVRWELANICVDHHAMDGLKRGTLVQILSRWEQDLFPDEPSLGKIVKIMVQSVMPPPVVKEIDETDVT